MISGTTVIQGCELTVDSIAQRNTHVKKCDCEGLSDETYIIQQRKNRFFELWKNRKGISEIAKIPESKPGTIFTISRDIGGLKPNERKPVVIHQTLSEREEIRTEVSVKSAAIQISAQRQWLSLRGAIR